MPTDKNSKKLLKFDCEAITIPSGNKVRLLKNTSVIITHKLGSHFTVATNNGIYRINGNNADALGESLTGKCLNLNINNKSKNSVREKLWQSLKQVFDPEIPVNIIDLGLVYSMEILRLNYSVHEINIIMTLTTPGCGMGPSISSDVKETLLGVVGVNSVNVEIVWSPPWNQKMISDNGKMQLGLT